MSMHVLRPSRRQLIFLISLSTLSGCALNDPIDRPRELAPGAGCHDLNGSYSNVSDTLSGHLLSQLFFDQEAALRHLEIAEVEFVHSSAASMTVIARTAAGRSSISREVGLACDDGRLSASGPSALRTEGAGFSALLWRSHKIWLARDAEDGLIAEVRQANTGLLLMSIPVATNHTGPVQRYRGLRRSPSDQLAQVPTSVSSGPLCSERRMSLCANGLKLDEDGKVSAEHLWNLLMGEEPPQGQSHVELETAPDGSLWLSALAGPKVLKRASLSSLGIRCDQGKPVPAADGGPSLPSAGTGPMSLFGMGIGAAWGSLQLVHAEDGAMLIRVVDRYAGTIMVAVPIYIDSEDWYRFEPLLAQRDWSTCPGAARL